MKKLTTLLFAVALLVGLSSVAHGQSSDDETISAIATVVQGMQVGNEFNNLVFSDVAVNSTKSIDPMNRTVRTNGNENVGLITTAERRGFISIEIAEGTKVDYSLVLPSELDETGSGNATLPITFDTSYKENHGGSATEFNGFLANVNPLSRIGFSIVDIVEGADGSDWSGVSGTITLDNIEMPSTNKVYLVLGGTVAAGPSQVLGEYEADITLTATVADD